MLGLISAAVAIGAFLAVATMSLAAWLLWQPSGEIEAQGPQAVRVARPLPRLASSLGSFARPDDPAERETLRAWLAQAGLGSARALEWYLAVRVGLTLALPVAVSLWLSPAVRGRPVWLLAAAGLGYFGPRLAVGWLRAARQRRLQRSLPNMMDMLVSCLEAGLGVDAALRYLAREVDVSSPVLADELRLANVSMTAGVPRTEALRDFDRRTGIEEITALVSVLSQAERFGAGVAPSVRAHAQLARRRRAVEAEQRAAQAAPYLTVAMVVFIMPSLFVVLVGPTVVNILQNFYPNGTVGLP